MSLRNWIDLFEGRAINVTLRSGKTTRLIVDPTRGQFQTLLAATMYEQVRCIFDGPRLCIGAAEFWTHHGMAKAIQDDGLDWSSGDSKIPDGFLVPDQAVFWGLMDLSMVPSGDDEINVLAESNREAHTAIWGHPVMRRLYPTPVRTSFFCGDGMMVTFEVDGSNDLVVIDIPLEN